MFTTGKKKLGAPEVIYSRDTSKGDLEHPKIEPPPPPPTPPPWRRVGDHQKQSNKSQVKQKKRILEKNGKPKVRNPRIVPEQIFGGG